MSDLICPQGTLNSSRPVRNQVSPRCRSYLLRSQRLFHQSYHLKSHHPSQLPVFAPWAAAKCLHVYSFQLSFRRNFHVQRSLSIWNWDECCLEYRLDNHIMVHKLWLTAGGLHWSLPLLQSRAFRRYHTSMERCRRKLARVRNQVGFRSKLLASWLIQTRSVPSRKLFQQNRLNRLWHPSHHLWRLTYLLEVGTEPPGTHSYALAIWLYASYHRRQAHSTHMCCPS